MNGVHQKPERGRLARGKSHPTICNKQSRSRTAIRVLIAAFLVAILGIGGLAAPAYAAGAVDLSRNWMGLKKTTMKQTYSTPVA